MAQVEGNHGQEWLLSELEEISFETGMLISGQNVVSGEVLGLITESKKYTLHNAAATDGSQDAVAISMNDCDASGGDTKCLVVARIADVAETKLTWKSGISAPNKTAAIANLALQYIIVRI